MTQTPAASPNPFAAMILGAFGFVARLIVGVALVLVAGLVALLTFFAGLMLTAAALTLRSRRRRERPVPAVAEGEPVTLEAHRTARGWTVE
jgi:membrane protein implicated in regulation of membrane protease activity